MNNKTDLLIQEKPLPQDHMNRLQNILIKMEDILYKIKTRRNKKTK
jgi:hypothetical protein